jgi:hypothetical protein
VQGRRVRRISRYASADSRCCFQSAGVKIRAAAQGLIMKLTTLAGIDSSEESAKAGSRERQLS